LEGKGCCLPLRGGVRQLGGEATPLPLPLPPTPLDSWRGGEGRDYYSFPFTPVLPSPTPLDSWRGKGCCLPLRGGVRQLSPYPPPRIQRGVALPSPTPKGRGERQLGRGERQLSPTQREG